MNRRSFLSAPLALLAGLAAAACRLVPEPRVRTSESVSINVSVEGALSRDDIRRAIEEAVSGPPPRPVVVLHPGQLERMVDADLELLRSYSRDFDIVLAERLP